MGGLRIGEVAKAGGVNLETIRYYEREGLIPEPPRLASGYRAFSRDAILRIRFIKRAQELGFSLKEIKELLSIRVDPWKDCSAVRAIAKAKIADVEQKIEALKAMRRVLKSVTETCHGAGPVSECPILESLDLDHSSIQKKRKEVKTNGTETR